MSRSTGCSVSVGIGSGSREPATPGPKFHVRFY